MKIVALQAENVKKLRAVEIRPDGNLVEITGKNGQGKTSVLDSIWWALAGASHIQAAPIRKGANEARIRLDLGEIKVTRSFKRGTAAKPGITTGIVVENAEGARFPSPQRMLDSLLGELTFDPLAFTRMEPGVQFDALRQFVPGVDFAAVEDANKADYAARTDLNRRAKEARTLAAKIETLADLPDELIDESALVDQLEKAGEHNSDIESRKARRQEAAAGRAPILQRVAGLRDKAKTLRTQADEVDAEADRLEAERAAVDKKLASAPALPEPIDTTVIRRQIDDARNQNRQIAARDERAALVEQAERLEAQSKALTAAMEKREAEKRTAIAAAKLPVEGIEFGDGAILMNGVPFDQASDAEQLRASVAIAMASNPKLRVIRVRDGSLLDDDAMVLLAEMADAADYQIWIERVDGSGRVGFVLEDGSLKAPAVEEALAAARGEQPA